jgi:hypothetical protein
MLMHYTPDFALFSEGQLIDVRGAIIRRIRYAKMQLRGHERLNACPEVSGECQVAQLTSGRLGDLSDAELATLPPEMATVNAEVGRMIRMEGDS